MNHLKFEMISILRSIPMHGFVHALSSLKALCCHLMMCACSVNPIPPEEVPGPASDPNLQALCGARTIALTINIGICHICMACIQMNVMYNTSIHESKIHAQLLSFTSENKHACQWMHKNQLGDVMNI